MAILTALDDMVSSKVVDTMDIARAIGTSPRNVLRWQASGSAPRRDAEERLLELKAVIDLLRVVLRPEPGRLWLRSPEPDLDYQKPLDLIAAGEYQRVIGELGALAEGITA